QSADCPYTIDDQNTILSGNRKIFSGFATTDQVGGDHKPVCSGGFVYAGLSTGELVKVNPNSRNIEWIADIYRASNMTGGAKLTDIVAPIVINGGYVYAAGLGDAFCKIRASNGARQWCLDIGVGVPFLIVDNFAFVVATNNYMYAINTDSGDVYWRSAVESQSAPRFENNVISVGSRERFNVADGGQI
ncbi:MAG: PQQ-like beta-propeller repeat protein, partial [Rickettsiales bacterium]|nr:PQQ-like beta-propeller repeat protein [Rickettsiales bacterium]